MLQRSRLSGLSGWAGVEGRVLRYAGGHYCFVVEFEPSLSHRCAKYGSMQRSIRKTAGLPEADFLRATVLPMASEHVHLRIHPWLKSGALHVIYSPYLREAI